MTTGFDRRRVLGMATALGAAATLGRGAVSRAQDSTPAATPAGGEWSFTDDKGVTVTLPGRPERLVMDVNVAAPLWDYGIRPAALFGWNVNPDGTVTDAGGNIDPAGIAIVGDAAETVRVEPLVAAEPDLVVTLTWEPDDPQEYWSFEPDILAQVQQRYPIAALSATARADEGVERFVEFAGLLGADLDAPEQVAARETFQARVEEVTAAIAAKPDLTFLFVGPTAEATYLASAPDWGDLSWYQALGLQIPDLGVEPGGFWLTISLEEIGAFTSDVLFRSSRPESIPAADLEADPVASLHPAIASGQMFDWNQDFILSYQGMTSALDAILAAVQASEKVT